MEGSQLEVHKKIGLNAALESSMQQYSLVLLPQLGSHGSVAEGWQTDVVQWMKTCWREGRGQWEVRARRWCGGQDCTYPFLQRLKRGLIYKGEHLHHKAFVMRRVLQPWGSNRNWSGQIMVILIWAAIRKMEHFKRSLSFLALRYVASLEVDTYCTKFPILINLFR